MNPTWNSLIYKDIHSRYFDYSDYCSHFQCYFYVSVAVTFNLPQVYLVKLGESAQNFEQNAHSVSYDQVLNNLHLF